MQTVEQYGFVLNASENVNNEDYLNIKSRIEKICRSAERAATYYDVSELSVAFHIYSNTLYATIHISNGSTLFGIYDKKLGIVSTEGSACLFKDFTDEDFNRFGDRCNSFAKLLSEGKKYNMGTLDDAWKEVLNVNIQREEPVYCYRGRKR